MSASRHRPHPPQHAASSPPSMYPRSPPPPLSKSTTVATTASSKGGEGEGEGSLTWTAENENRLVYVQGKLREAQAAWSEEQEVWIDEVLQLEELKRSCLKAEKKSQAMVKRRGNSVAGLLKRPSWGKGGGKMEDGGTRGAAGGGNGDDEGVEDSDDNDGDDELGVESSAKTTSRRPSLSTLLRRTMSLGSKNRSGSQSRRNTLDSGQTARLSLTTSPEGSLEGSEVEEIRKAEGKGKFMGRRGSGR